MYLFIKYSCHLCPFSKKGAIKIWWHRHNLLITAKAVKFHCQPASQTVLWCVSLISIKNIVKWVSWVSTEWKVKVAAVSWNWHWHWNKRQADWRMTLMQNPELKPGWYLIHFFPVRLCIACTKLDMSSDSHTTLHCLLVYHRRVIKLLDRKSVV